MFHSFHNCCQSFSFSHRHKLGLKRQMKKKCKIYVAKKQKRPRPVYFSPLEKIFFLQSACHSHLISNSLTFPDLVPLAFQPDMLPGIYKGKKFCCDSASPDEEDFPNWGLSTPKG